jgi:hypothetical protein
MVKLGDLMISVSRIPAWDPGVRGGIPNVLTKVNVRDFGARGDGETDDTAALKTAISACPRPGAVYLPAGSYVIKGRIEVPSGVVLRGDGPQNTRILVTPMGGRHTFVVVGSKGRAMPLTATAPQGSNQVSVANVAPFAVGQTVELEMDNEPFMDPMIYDGARGQIVKVVGISGRTLTLDVPLRLEYSLTSNPRVYPMMPGRNVGFEDFYVKHVSSDGDESNIFQFWIAENCWVKNVESESCARYHVNLRYSRHITIRDNVIHHAHNYGGGGHGYGVVTGEKHTSDCLITNNTFYMLRHSFLPSHGGNGNVWSYNFSADDNSRLDQIGLADLNLHGNFGYMDLVEGNVVQWCKIGGYWGQQGPHNTLFRNRMVKSPHSKPTDRYRAGIEIDHPSHGQNIIGNTLFGRIRNTGSGGLAHELWIEKNLICQDGVAGNVTQSTVRDNVLSCDQVASWRLPDSLYLPEKPDFWGDLPWPAVGADIDSQRQAAGLALHKIPAQIRYEQIRGLIPSPGEIIIDNTDPGFSTSYSRDAWQEYVRVGGQHYGDSHHFNEQIDSGQDTATWSFTVPTPGIYDVYAWWWEGDFRPPDVPYAVNHSGGSTTVRADQRTNGGQWNLLGTFCFQDEGSVVVSDDVSLGRAIVADAIRLVYRSE